MSDLLDYFNQDELAASVWKGKYALEGEETPDDMHRRMAKEFARIERKYDEEKVHNNKYLDTHTLNKLSIYGRNRDSLTENSIYSLFKDFKYICPQGSIMSQLGNNTSIGSISNCVVIGQPEDSYGGIFQKDEEAAQLFKRRCGVGIDISTLRPEGTDTTNSAKTSTGAVSFMERYSNTTREVAQNGRRGALMISMDIRHPDIMDFIKSKEDLTKITGANISVMIRDDFMDAVKADDLYTLRFPCDAGPEDATHCNIIRAREYWEALTTAAHKSAEPGIIFIDKHWSYSPDGVYIQYRGVTTNPCGEIFMPKYDACRLMALNLFSFVLKPFTDEATIDFNMLYKVAYEQQRLADDLIDLEVEKIDKILEKIKDDPESIDVKETEYTLWSNVRKVALSGRRTGCGITGLGDMLAAMGLKYDSKTAQNAISFVMREKMKAELDCTIDLAILRGTFEDWDSGVEIDDLSYEDEKGNDRYVYKGHNDFYIYLSTRFPEQESRMRKYGRRNVSWSTVAPTGSLSILTQTTSGLEPLFAPYYMRRKKVNPDDEGVRVDFTDDNGDTWQEYFVLHPKFMQWWSQYHKDNIEKSILDDIKYGQSVIYVPDFTNKESLDKIFKESPWYQSTANDIDWIKRIEIQSIIQKFTTHSISSTINLPSDISVEEVATIYEKAWDLGLKGVTVYRDGCRSGVLVTDDSTKLDKFGYNDSIKRPKELDAEYYYATSQGKKYAVIVGLIEGKPYEIFAFENPLTEEHLKGKIIKVRKGVYKFTSNKYTIENLQLSSEQSDEKLLTRLVSSLLRHGVHPKYVIEQTEKTELGINSFGKVLIRTLKRFISDGEESTVLCDNCNSDAVVFEEGCRKCKNCGESKCG